MNYGVIVARFQVPELHLGHVHLIREVMKRHDKVIILLGISASVPTEINPLSYEVRKHMVIQHFPNVIVEGLYDIPGDDHKWTAQLDEILKKYEGTPTLYGSRKSFAPHYKGHHTIEEIQNVYERSGTDVRNELIAPIHTTNFRAGIIHNVMNRFPIVYSTVDIACLRYSGITMEILMGKKSWETKYRFPGGFIDKKDKGNSLNAAKREFAEEVGMIEVTGWVKIGETEIDDPRYRGTKDSIMTHFYGCSYVYGGAEASDDLAQVKWLPVSELGPDTIIDIHLPLVDKLKEFLKGH